MVWIEQQDAQIVITHKFHSKYVTSKAVINGKPAISSSTKRAVITQEILRVLLNFRNKTSLYGSGTYHGNSFAWELRNL